MKKLIQLCCAVALLTLAPALPCQASTFTIGVAPHTSARMILEMYQPLRRYLEKTLGYQVDIVTAPDFNEFVKRGISGAYDIAITTSHQARLLETDAGYLPLVTYKADFRSVALVASNGKVKTVQDLEGKKVLGLSPTSQVTLWGQHWLKHNGVNATMKYVSASDSVAQLVAAGVDAAGFTSLANYQKLPSPLRSQVRIMAQSETMPGRVYVLSPRHTAQYKKIESALWAFAATAEGKKYFADNKLDGFRRLKPGELASMDPYAAEVRKVLQGKGQ